MGEWSETFETQSQTRHGIGSWAVHHPHRPGRPDSGHLETSNSAQHPLVSIFRDILTGMDSVRPQCEIPFSGIPQGHGDKERPCWLLVMQGSQCWSLIVGAEQMFEGTLRISKTVRHNRQRG